MYRSIGKIANSYNLYPPVRGFRQPLKGIPIQREIEELIAQTTQYLGSNPDKNHLEYKLKKSLTPEGKEKLSDHYMGIGWNLTIKDRTLYFTKI